MNVKLDENVFSKGLETLANATRIASNLTEGKPKEPEKPMNQPHNQTVEVKVGGENTEAKKPVILKEKHETHIHKPFPDGRALTAEECAIEKLRIEKEYEEKQAEREYRIWLEEENRKERREREAREREEAERRRAEDRKFYKRLGIITGILGAAGLGYAGYCRYTDSRNAAGGRMAVSAPEAIRLTDGDGTIS